MEAASTERKNHLYLSHEQREELKEIVNHESHTRGIRARALLLLDEGLHGPGLSIVEVAERVKRAPGTISDLVSRAVELGPKRAAIGMYAEAQKGRTYEYLLKQTPEQVADLLELYSTGQFTKAELARRAGVHPSTVGRIIKRNQDENGLER